tara:strand:- start:1672 stop:2382 length:711 start_codon:yes stop_codon:yes gene_type:complete
MATKATLILTSDISSQDLSITTSSTLSKAGGAVALAQATGLARKTTTTTAEYTLFHADDYTDSKAHKLYIKNTSTTPADFFTISNGSETLGLMYAGDWALIPWGAINGTRATFTIAVSVASATDDWATGDTLTFDGTVITQGATETIVAMQALIAAGNYTNWTAAATSSSLTTFTAKRSDYFGAIEAGVASDAWVESSSDGVHTVASVTAAVASANDIKITPGQAANTIEYMLFNE